MAGTASDCSSSSTAAICKYAGFNGFTATTSASSWGTSTPVGAVAVNWTFPASVTGVTASAAITYPFLRVVIQQKAPTWFIGVLGIKSMTVGASCTCGLPSGGGTAPLVILNPSNNGTLAMTGGVHIVITGGPTVSIQVDSSSNTAVSCSNGSGTVNTIDTSTAVPSGTGGQLAIVGGPTLNPTCGALQILKDPGNTLWNSSGSVVPSPYAGVPTPSQPIAPQMLTSSPIGDTTGCIQNTVSSSNVCSRKDPTYGLTTGIWVGPGTDSCPATSTSTSNQHSMGSEWVAPYKTFYGSCLEFTPGYYDTGVDLSSLAQQANDVAIFRPGVYYLNGDLNVANATTIRNAWIGTQPSTQGVFFYFLTGGPIFSGSSGAANSLISSVPSYYLNCSSTATPAGLPTSLTGNILASQCSSGGTYVALRAQTATLPRACVGFFSSLTRPIPTATPCCVRAPI